MNCPFVLMIGINLITKFPKISDDPDTYNGGHINYFTFGDLRNLLKKSGLKLLYEEGIAYRSYRSIKTIIFRYLMRLWETEIEKEFFCKGIVIKAEKCNQSFKKTNSRLSKNNL